jgi:aminoglycoside/choline kinase family phosphotransferase
VLLKQKKKLNTYKKLVDLLLRIQKIKPKKKIETIFNKKHFLDEYSYNYLDKESNLFFEWYLPLFLNKKKTLKIKKILKKILKKIYKKLYFPNSYFVHRDFHTQNLMKVGKKIGVIDSQDALIGNPAYDLVSLIDDVRIKTPLRLKNQIYNYYLKNSPIIYRYNSKRFLNDFNILSIQRSLKIIGIFSRLATRDKKGKYLKLIPYTWQLLENRMKHKDFSELKKILKKIVPISFRKKIIYR